jgi:hypothetical protein
VTVDHRQPTLPHWREHWDATRPPEPPASVAPLLVVLGLFGLAVAAAIVADLVKH